MMVATHKNDPGRLKQRRDAAKARQEKWEALTIDKQIATNPGPRVVAKLEKRRGEDRRNGNEVDSQES